MRRGRQVSRFESGDAGSRWHPIQQPHRAPGVQLRAKLAVIGVVRYSLCTFFIRLACVTPDAKPSGPLGPIGRRIWIALAAAAGVTVVILSWRVPEPQSPASPRQVENMSYLKYTPQQAPPPNYGAR